MKYHVIRPLSNFINTKAIDAFHNGMFHGRASRGGAMPNSGNYRIAYPPDRPLRLHKNAFEIAHFFMPEFECVVSSQVESVLSDLPWLTFEPVVFEILFSYPYRANDFSFWKELKNYYIQQDFMDAQVDDPRLHDEIDAYYHLIMPSFRANRDRYPDWQEITLSAGPRDPEPDAIQFSRKLISECGVYHAGTSVIANDDVYAKLSPFIDENYFTHVEADA